MNPLTLGTFSTLWFHFSVLWYSDVNRLEVTDCMKEYNDINVNRELSQPRCLSSGVSVQVFQPRCLSPGVSAQVSQPRSFSPGVSAQVSHLKRSPLGFPDRGPPSMDHHHVLRAAAPGRRSALGPSQVPPVGRRQVSRDDL